MTGNGNGQAVEILPVSQLPDTPTPRSGRLRLGSIQECRRELAKLYVEARRGEIPTATATRLAYLLVSLANMIRDSELEARVAALEAGGIQE